MFITAFTFISFACILELNSIYFISFQFVLFMLNIFMHINIFIYTHVLRLNLPAWLDFISILLLFHIKILFYSILLKFLFCFPFEPTSWARSCDTRAEWYFDFFFKSDVWYLSIWSAVVNWGNGKNAHRILNQNNYFHYKFFLIL